jgi:hypothetical protein
MKFYKKLLKFIPIFVVLVVLPRVADFVGHMSPPGIVPTLIRFAFAASLGLGTIATAYFSDEAQPPIYDDKPANPRERRRREREAAYYAAMLTAAPYAKRAMWLFATLDGTFNLADAAMGAAQNGLFRTETHGSLAYLYAAGTIIFGIAPTVLAIALTRLISLVDRIPEDYERPISTREMDWMRTIMGNLGLKEYRAGKAAELITGERSPERTYDFPESVRRMPAERRTNGGQTERIIEYLNNHTREGRVPGVTEIREALEEPKPSKSTISEVRTAWLNQYNPWRANAN